MQNINGFICIQMGIDIDTHRVSLSVSCKQYTAFSCIPFFALLSLILIQNLSRNENNASSIYGLCTGFSSESK